MPLPAALAAVPALLSTNTGLAAATGAALAGGALYNAVSSNDSNEKDKKQQERDELMNSNEVVFDKDGIASLQNINDKQQQDNTTNPQNQSDNETMQLAEGINHAVNGGRYRNTGIDYFDKLEKPTIGDLYLAKMLGLNMAYNYVDLNANVNQKTTNRNAALNKMYSTNNAVAAFTEGIDEYMENDLGSVGNRVSRGWNRLTGGALSWTSDDNRKEQGLNEYRTRAVASMMSENPRGVTQKELDIARDMVSTNWKDQSSVLADTHNFLTLARMKQQEEMNKITELGMNIPQEEALKLAAIDNMIKSVQGGNWNSQQFKMNREAILHLQQNKGNPKAINKAMQMIFKDKAANDKAH